MTHPMAGKHRDLMKQCRAEYTKLTRRPVALKRHRAKHAAHTGPLVLVRGEFAITPLVGSRAVNQLAGACREINLDISVRVIHVASSCGQPGEENSNIAANKWLMVAIPRCCACTRILNCVCRWSGITIQKRGARANICAWNAGRWNGGTPPDNRKE